ncbi:unnamed protein product [Peniophora sp. CBMAI 1063]|nr:unnamed protein product [Peniophora sp. CBMAI 1063]
MDHTTKLHTENLVYIFEIVHSALDAVEPDERTHSPTMSWISATSHVCSRWRAVALGTPTLWADIPVDLGVRWANKFVQRSRPAPMSINIPASRSSQLDVKMATFFLNELIPKRFRRIRKLVAYDLPACPASATLSLSWPALETLDLRFNSRPPIAKLLDGRAPSLRCLRLHVRLPDDSRWMIPALHRLRVLDIGFAYGIDDRSMNDFLDALTRMPDLRHLRIKAQLPYINPPARICSSCATRTVLVPLRAFACYSTPYTMVHIMQHLMLPPDVKVMLWLSDTPGDRPDGPYLAEKLAILCSRLQSWFARTESDRSSPFIAAGIMGDKDLWTPKISLSRSINSLGHLSMSSRGGLWNLGTEDLYPELSIEFPFSVRNIWVAVVMDTISQLAPDGYCGLSLNLGQLLPDEGYQFLRHPVFQRVQALSVATPYPGLLALQGYLPEIQVLDVRTPDIMDVYLGKQDSDANWDKMVCELEKRRERNPLSALYLHLSEAITLVRNGQHAHPQHGEQDVKGAVEAIEAVPEVRVVPRDSDVDFVVPPS